MEETKESESSEKLYAGKFKTVEELEVGYKNSLPVFQENETLKKQLNDLTSVPTDYISPTDVQLEENYSTDLKTRAKEVGLTQEQYEKLVRSEKKRLADTLQRYESNKKEVGEETINVLKDYVSNNYPQELHDDLLRNFIGNKEARQAALKHRDQLLNSSAPGLNKPAVGNYNVTREDILKARKSVEESRGNAKEKAKAHYIKLLSIQAEQKQQAS